MTRIVARNVHESRSGSLCHIKLHLLLSRRSSVIYFADSNANLHFRDECGRVEARLINYTREESPLAELIFIKPIYFIYRFPVNSPARARLLVSKRSRMRDLNDSYLVHK